MSASILTLSGLDHASLEIAPSYIAIRDKYLAEAKRIEAISDDMDADAAAAVLRDIVQLAKQCEATRNEIKAPVLDLGRHIDATARDYAAPLTAEKSRLERILGVWQQAQREKAEKAQREAAAEARRIAEEEARKIAAAEVEHGAESAEVQQAVVASADRIAEARLAQASAAPSQPKGTAVRKSWQFEVVDLKALAAAHPELVIVSPNKAAINAILKHNQSIPGLRVWEEIKAIIR